MTDQLAPTAGWCPPGGCPARTAGQLEHAVTLAFEAGRAYERAELAQLEVTWKPLARQLWEERVADRVAQMQAHAERQEWNTWRGRFPGGPVDYETGRPRVVFSAPGRAA